MVECRNLWRKGERLPPHRPRSEPRHTDGRPSSSIFERAKAHHDVRVGIEGDRAALQPWARASRTSAAMSSWCPRCTPSNTPMAMEVTPCSHSSNASAVTMRASVRLAREKIHAELASGQHHRTPPIACGKTCSMTKRPPSMRARARPESPSRGTNANWRLRGIEIGKRTLNGNASAAEQVVGKIARQVNTM